MEIHRQLGHGFLEAVYKDAFEVEARNTGLYYEREKEYIVTYKGQKLKHSYRADLLVEEMIIVEVKAAENAINNDIIAKTLNYLKVSNCKLALIINFGRRSLEYKRLIF